MLAVFLLLDLLWSWGLNALEQLFGLPTLPSHPPGSGASSVDALWHIATAFVLVLPVRNRVLLVLAPALSLALDVDHLFGSEFPTVFLRSAHDLLFVALLALVMYAAFGRPGAFVALGAVLTHLGVDGGTFPLFAPVSTAQFGLPFAGQVSFLTVAALLFFLSAHSSRQLRETRNAVPLLAVVAAVGLLLYALWPLIDPWVST